MSAQWRADGASRAESDAAETPSAVRQGRWAMSTPAPQEARGTVQAAPLTAHATVPTGDDAIDADVAALTAATQGPLDGVLETAERLHLTLQRRLVEGGDA